MKRTIFSTLCFAALTCAAQSIDPTLASSYNDFAFDFFQRIEREHYDENLILSPLSAQFAISMLQNGASGRTLSEIQQALHTAGYSLDDVNRYNRALIDRLKAEPKISDWEREEFAAIGKDPRDNYARVEIANGIWTNEDLPVYPSFFETNATYYDASAEAVDFANPETYARLDQWAYDHTHGLIPSFGLDPDDPDREMVLANALYFESPWSDPFKGTAVKQNVPFTNADGTVTTSTALSRHSICRYAETELFECYRLHYGQYSNSVPNFYMNLYLPKYGDPMTDQVRELTADEWRKMNATYETAEVDFQMPTFAIEDNISLVDVLRAMGISDAFDSQYADFSAISPQPLCVSGAYQKARIEVDENGTAAAALTVIGFDATDVGEEPTYRNVTLHFDRPFYFTIEDGANILFMGHITDLTQLMSKMEQAGIDTVLAPSPASQRTYDLQGRVYPEHQSKGSTANGQRGISIHDGRKTIR